MSSDDPFKEATPTQALAAIAIVFVVGLVLGFVLCRTI